MIHSTPTHSLAEGYDAALEALLSLGRAHGLGRLGRHAHKDYAHHVLLVRFGIDQLQQLVGRDAHGPRHPLGPHPARGEGQHEVLDGGGRRGVILEGALAPGPVPRLFRIVHGVCLHGHGGHHRHHEHVRDAGEDGRLVRVELPELAAAFGAEAVETPRLVQPVVRSVDRREEGFLNDLLRGLPLVLHHRSTVHGDDGIHRRLTRRREGPAEQERCDEEGREDQGSWERNAVGQ